MMYASFSISGSGAVAASFRIVCEVLNAAESTGLLTKAQRADVVERAIDRMRNAATGQDRVADLRLFEEFKTGCPVVSSL